ncbi:MAG TPA: biotin--[acetyl-CoA-carboxylase] ligase [Ktedonobacteraceae bacterium]|nr:biotin--[acetyl-CoA-carboxylase] ligase [Ktedonobacteraceae bacterium]
MNETGSSTTQFNIALLQQQLRTLSFAIGNRLVYVPTVGSTNVLAMQLARAGSEEGLLVLTDSQSAGKGRHGRRWVDVYGCNILSSLLLRPLFPLYLLVMIASLAVVEAIQGVVGEHGITATIKWPNDVLVGNRKVAGILVETSHDRSGQLVAIVGIGVNVNGRLTFEEGVAPEMAALTATATTLETVYGQQISREFFLAALLRHIEAYYLALQQEARTSSLSNSIASTGPISRSVREKWRSYLSTLDRTIQVRQGDTVLEGIAEDVNETGELLLRLHSGEHISISWGDIGYPTA